MKIVRKVLDLLFEYPVIWLVAACVYWLATAPADPILLMLVGVCLVVTIVECLPIKNNTLQIVLLCILALVSIAVELFIVFLLLIFFSYIDYFFFHDARIGLMIFLVLVLTILGVSVFRKLTLSGAGWFKKLLIVLFALNCVLAAFYIKIFYPKEIDAIWLDGNKYYFIGDFDEDMHSHYSLHKCNNLGLSCERVRQIYSHSDMHALVDKENHEINLIKNTPDSDLERALVYTYGEKPRSYSGYAGKLGNHVYQISWECDKQPPKGSYSFCDGSFTYTLYECNLDYIDCHSLPIKYTSLGQYPYLSWEVNENAREINLYSDYDFELDRFLILTYGERPRCYAEGCEILNSE
jgi:hypothetical protein